MSDTNEKVKELTPEELENVTGGRKLTSSEVSRGSYDRYGNFTTTLDSGQRVRLRITHPSNPMHEAFNERMG